MSVHFIRRMAGFAGALIALALTACSTPISTPVPPETQASLINQGRDGLLVPLRTERSDAHGRSSIGLPVQMDGKAVYLMLDTGTHGTRVLSSVLPRSNYPAAGARSTLAFATDAQVSGAAVTVPFSIGGTKPMNIDVQAVDEVSCLKINKHCVAQDGYTGEFGWAFSGILGVGADDPRDPCCTQPLRALPANIGQRYLVRAQLDRPFLVLSPSNALTKNFTLVALATGQDGSARWPVGCVQVGSKMRFCAPVVFSTGGTDMIRVETDKAPDWASDVDEHMTLAQGNYDVVLGVGDWAHRFNDAQTTIVKTAKGANRIVVGLMSLQNIDLLFDFAHGQLGLRASRDVERMGS
ncbi:hypothetical protein PPMP20_28450 [Paraburkholderia phymatum]|uniref:Lipoprotein n=1 Tax=Paraburkholderia phymatum (strain DSM 17167 / CIP 108236 / LMG 21445 / STM815) TaxID=391038 RepID=B2JN72_PARP8|nr:hypothetical protein [Paraburkholderia phymatum]ACC72920.1 conserved hypothetical protein [Paraburkholderia phymatum STM815]